MNLDRTEEMEMVSETIGLISKKWHSRILYQLLKKENVGFSDLRNNLEGISNKVLSESLKDLMDNGIVEKIEEGNSTQYRLTQKGKDMEPIFTALADWGRKHLSEDQVKILIIEDNEEQAIMYKRWLEHAYDVEIATDRDEAFRELTENVDVVLLDRRLPKASAEEMLESSKKLTRKQIIMITGVEPDLDLIELEVDDYIVKPISKDDLQKSVERIVKATEGTDRGKELVSLLSKKAVLDRKKTHGVRETEEYKELVERIDEIRSGMDGVPDVVEETESPS